MCSFRKGSFLRDHQFMYVCVCGREYGVRCAVCADVVIFSLFIDV